MKRYLVPTRLDRTDTATPVDVTGRSDREVERIIRGMLINMSDEWFVDEIEEEATKS